MARANRILDTVTELIKAELGGYTSVKRNNMRPSRVNVPMISISFGGDEPVINNLSFIDWEMRVNISISLYDQLDEMDQVFLDLRASIHKALMTDPTLGIDFVQSVMPEETYDPEFSDEADRFAVTVVTVWVIKYRTSKDNIGA